MQLGNWCADCVNRRMMRWETVGGKFMAVGRVSSCVNVCECVILSLSFVSLSLALVGSHIL